MDRIQEIETIVSKCRENGLATHEFKIRSVDQLLSENKRYKEALEEIMKIEPLPGEYAISGVVKNIIRQALKD